MDADKKRTIESRLREQRKELIIKRLGIEESWQNLHANEIELTEKATNEYLAAGLSQLDEQDIKKIEAIDRALARLQADIYDICESCGEVISEKRLGAVPWTTLCRDCAEEREQGPRPKRPAVEIEEETE
jgi:RNA polymerase-binding transcription factor DksA